MIGIESSSKSASAELLQTASNLDAILSNDFRATLSVSEVDERWLEGHGPTVTAYGVVVQGEGWANYSYSGECCNKRFFDRVE